MHVFKLVTQSERTDSKTEVTRWVYKDEVTNKTWEALNERLKQLFDTSLNQFFVSWFDGTDYCTIRDYHDLLEAIEFFAEANEKAVRLFVSPDKREHHTIFGERPDGEHEPASEEHVTESEPEESKKCDLDTTAEPSTSEPSTSEPEESPQDEPPTPEAPQLKAAMATVPVALAPFPMAPYVPYGMQYPYGQFYPPVQPNTMYPMMTPAQPATQSLPNEPTSTIPKPAECVPSAPPLIGSPLAGPTVPTIQKSEPDIEMLNAIHNLSKAPGALTPTPTVAKPSVSAPAEQPEKKAKSNYITVGLQTLRSMGYQQDTKELRNLLKVHKGNLNEVIDQLEKTNI